MEYIKHVGRYLSRSRNAAYEAPGSADNPLEAAQTHSRETNIECGAVVKPRCDKSVDRASRGIHEDQLKHGMKEQMEGHGICVGIKF